MKINEFIRERKIGELTVMLPEPPIESEILNFELEQKKQKWKPTKIPSDFDRLPFEEQITFIRKELKIREEGYWFYNNGNIEYLTGIHYFYLTYWHLPEGLPRWTDGDRDFFYLWDYCVKDPQCFGMLDIENRRGGKTAKSTCILYEYASKTKNIQCGIQSKTNGDGKAVFNKLKASWKKLHSIWKPTDTGETNPASALRFEEPSVKSTKGAKKTYKDVLNSYIDFQPSVEEAYDGFPLQRLFVDEFGKCHRKGTEILMYDGSIKKVEDINVGDLLMGDDSLPRKVLNLARGREKCYDVVSYKHKTFGCNESHILSLKLSSTGKLKGYKRNDTFNVSIKDYLKLSKVQKQHLMLWRTGVEFNEQETTIPPYILGAWLGDGSHSEPVIHKHDIELYNEIKQYANSIGLSVRTDSDGLSHHITCNKVGGKNKFLSDLRSLNLLNNKHIPNHYLINSTKSRLELLAGLLDTDGHLMSRKDKISSGYEITQKRKELSEGIKNLALSLGFYATLKTKIASMKRKDGTYYRCEVYPVFIYGDIDKIPCRIKRKKAEPPSKHKNRRNPLRHSFNLIDVGEDDYYGFTLDGNHLYLLGDYVVTHNTIEANVSSRWNIQKFCLINPYSESGTDIIGKAIFTTTIEELEKKGGKNAKALWDNSNPNDRGADGRTKTGLYRYFKPANYGHAMFMDEYGYSDKEGAKKYLLRQREALTGNALYDLMRKQPLTIEEAFIVSDKSEIFPAFKIYEQKRYNETIYEPLYRVGNFVWVDEEQKKVEFFDDENGKWKVSKLLDENMRNAKEVKRNGIAPANKSFGLLGVDPYDHSTTVGDRKSNAAMYLFRTFDATEPLRSRCFVLEYINRPATVEILFDDIIKTAIYYGVEIFVETQKPGLINECERRGLGNYIKKINHADVTQNGADKEHKGLSTSGTYVRESLMSNTVSYIYDSIGKLSAESQQKRGIMDFNSAYHGFCPFDALLNQWLEFDVNDWTKYDAVVASSIAILGTTNLRVQKKEKKQFNIKDYFKTTSLR